MQALIYCRAGKGVRTAELMPTSESVSELSAEQIRAQRDRILGSNIFVRSKRQIDFLSYVVEAQLEGRGASLKEFSLGIDVFERDDSFNPKIDSIVRVEASRLRSKLREYYQEEGINDPVLIDVPKGHYVPEFRHRPVDLVHAPQSPNPPFLNSNLSKALVGIVGVLIVSGTLFLIDRFAEQTGAGDGSSAEDHALAIELDASIAVLPFRNLSSVAEDIYFVDGVHDDILTQLSKLSFLDKVISRTSVEQYRDTTKTIVTIGKELGVAIILEGSVQRAGERVRINAQLIDATTDKHMWSETYDRQLSTANIFAIQSEIADVIANALQTTLSVSEQKAIAAVPTESLEAYELYQQAQLIRRTLGLGSREQVAELLQRAVSLDPEFALAHVGLARAYIDRYFSSEQNILHRNLAQEALDTAVRLSPEMPEVTHSVSRLLLQRLFGL